MSMSGGTPLAIAGFETGSVESYANLALSSGSSISSARARTGTYSLLCPKQQYAAMVVPASKHSLGAGFAFFMEDQDTTEGTLEFFLPQLEFTPGLAIRTVGGVRKLAMVISNGAPFITDLWVGSQTLSLDTWYVIDFFTYKQGSYYWPARAKLYNNSLTLLEDTGWRATINPYAALIATSSVVYVGLPRFAVYTHNFHYDDVVLTAGSPAPIGAKIVGVVPSADDGTAADDGFLDTGGGATTWDDVDELPPDDDTSYATSVSGSTNIQLFSHASVADPASTNNILALAVYNRFKRDAASGTAIGQTRIKTSGGALAMGSASTTTSYKAIRGLWTTSPAGNGWTSGTGSETSINDVAFGHQKVLTHQRFTQSIMEVAWGTDWTNTGDHRFFPDKKNYILGGI